MQLAADRLRAEAIRLRKMAGSCDSDIEKQLQTLIGEMQSIANGLDKVDQQVKSRRGSHGSAP